MKRKNATRNALFTSVLSLLLCVSMLVGTTFAWFTDEVVSGKNTIAAGNLDVELLAGGEKVNSDTELFKLVDAQGKDTWWEPGMVVYENLQVANVGTLALKYQMSLNFGNENNLNGHKLSEVLQIAVIDKVADNATRAEVLAAAEAKIAADGKDASLSNFYVTGELEAGAKSTEQAVVIFWAPNANEIDNLYNANNGQKTSDEKPLHIEFGVNLQATQKMSENDSFGNDYDDFASILPKAIVNNVSASYPTVMATDGIGGTASEIPMDFALQFLPNETLDEAMTSDYKYYNIDFVIKADKDVPAESIALAGFYSAWCDGLNNRNWVALTSSTDIAANTEIRLVDGMGGGAIKVSYKDICQYAVRPENSINGFLCGATDLTGENAGTTITVELRAYETTSDPTDSSNTGVEVGPDAYKVIGKYSYTFGFTEAASIDEVNDALANGEAVKIAQDIVAEADTETFFMGANDLPVVVDGEGAVITTNGSGTASGNYGYVAFVPAPGEDAEISNVTVEGKGFVEVGDYDIGGGGDYTINNLTIKDFVSTYTVKNGSDTIAAAFGHYGNAVMNDCVITGTTSAKPGYDSYDVGLPNKSTTTINGGEYGSIYVWSQAHATIKGAKVDTITNSAITTKNLGMLTIGAGTEVGTIKLTCADKYTPALTIEDGATVGAIIYKGVSYTQAEWLAAHP